VHRHHASRLHYDLRLEQDGALRSWAVPKGLPPRPGVKRLAVNVEDHPLEYLTFEGEIPKGEYGAGPMWVYALGTYEKTKEKTDGSLYFRLQSKQVTAEFRMYNTRGKDWLLERVDAPQVDWLHADIEPMLAESQDEVPVGGEWSYEVKWDGVRAMIAIDDGEVRIKTRSQRDVTANFPELCQPEEQFYANAAVFDGEIVCLDDAGRPLFTDVMGRIHAKGDSGIDKARGRHPAVCYLFDCLYLDGRPILDEPLERRRAWLADAVRGQGGDFRVSETVDDGEALFEAAKTVGVEGIVAKERDGRYLVGKRSSTWRKIKVRSTIDCLIVGYTAGKGDRKRSFGALHLAQPKADGDGLKYLGKVGGGFDDKTLASVLKELKKLVEVERPVREKPVDDAETIWVEPTLYCEVQYASFANTGALREAVFLRMRPDLTDDIEE
jgi:DNA ligase D-like protein (predicted ligase)/DNA ligase D-like protein (predicted 3'-phosphoesterase)